MATPENDLPDIYKPRLRRPEPDVCGILPSGEHCSLDHGHEGKHMKLVMRMELTQHQDP